MNSGPSHVELRFSRTGKVVLGLAMLGLVAALVAMVVLWDDESLFFARDTHQPGFIKGFERLVGWVPFVALVAMLGLLSLVTAAVQFWKVANPVPEIAANPEGLEFHPAVHGPARYADVSDWRCDGTLLSIRFREPYWSLQGLIRRRSVKINGSRKELEPLANYLLEQPEMKDKYHKRRR